MPRPRQLKRDIEMTRLLARHPRDEAPAGGDAVVRTVHADCGCLPPNVDEVGVAVYPERLYFWARARLRADEFRTHELELPRTDEDAARTGVHRWLFSTVGLKFDGAHCATGKLLG